MKDVAGEVGTKGTGDDSVWPCLAFGAVLLVVYLANGREISQHDTIPATVQVLCMARGEGYGIFLERYGFIVGGSDPMPDISVTWKRGRLVSRYPVAPGMIASPLVGAQALVLDRIRPGWDAKTGGLWDDGRMMAKNSAAVIVALTGALLLGWLRALGLRRAAWPAALAACLGSDLWTVGSQALWQHGPAALALVATGWLLTARGLSRRRASAAGITAALLVACRSMDLPFAVLTFAWVARNEPRRLAYFLAGPVTIGGALIAYNLYFFDTLSGGLAELESMHPALHGVPGMWSRHVIAGMLGTLFSPARGLFVYCPWALFAVVVGPRAWQLLRPFGHMRWMVLGLLPHLLIVSAYSVWWAGHCFGPRYWTEVMPLFAVLFALGIEWARRRSRRLLVVAWLTLASAIGVQAVGAFLYPSSWNAVPFDVDRHHERLWHLLDNEVTRCLFDFSERQQNTRRGRAGG